MSCHQECHCPCPCCQSGNCGNQAQSCNCACHKQQCMACGCSHEQSGHFHQGHAGACEIEEQEEETSGRMYDLLELADEAWMEVLKEKIKERIRNQDTKIDQLADIVAEANHTRWRNKISDQQNYWAYEDQIMDLMHQQKKPEQQRYQAEGKGKKVQKKKEKNR